MNLKNRECCNYVKMKKVMVFFVTLGIIFSTMSVSNVKAAVDAALFFDKADVPSATTVNVGGTVTLVAQINPGTNNVGAAAINVTFNPAVLRLDSITRSAAFNTTLLGPTIDNTGTGDTDGNGSIEVGLLTNPATYVTVNPSDIATFVFTALSSATNSPVSFAVNSDASASGAYVVATRTGTQVTVTDEGGTTPPTLAEVTPVTPDPTNDTTPAYTFSTTGDGTITYGGSCASATTAATIGNNTISFDTLASGTYSNCTIRVTEADAGYSTLNVSPFTIDATAPVVAQVTAVTTPTNDTTPAYSFSSTEAGTVAYGGDCSGTAGGAVSSGNTTVSFATLGAGAHSNCTVTVTDAVGNASNVLAVNSFTIDTTAPTVAEVTVVTTPTNDATPAYTFSSTEAGTISYGGSCSSATTTASVGDNTISFNTLASGTYSNCTITVTDSANNASNVLAVTAFTVDAAAPTRSAGAPSGTLAAGTTGATVSLTTNENATCKYSTTAGVAFASMTADFTTTGATSHSVAVSGLTNGTTYSYFVRCEDALNNASASDYTISFSVGSPAVVVATPAASSDSDNHSSSSKKKKKTPSRSITNSKKKIARGAILTQRGKKFSKNSIVMLYFSKPGGGFYAPTRIKTAANGSFLVTYRVNKPSGKYSWYAVDTVTGKRSKTITYTVK